MANRLAASTSPYLRQHAENPVDWHEWGEEAFAKAKAEDKPVFLSVGYSSCHWCHVMAHESFEDPGVADILNQLFISIKVDREERPDVDEVYMNAVQMLTGRGGWPMTVFLTPDRKPFFGGTYFPKMDRGGYPGFVTLLRQIATLWFKERGKVLESAEEISSTLKRVMGRSMSSLTSTLSPELPQQCFAALRASFDPENGGFGEAPKFPAHTSLAFLMDYAAVSEADAGQAVGMVFSSLRAMALGGIHDHVGGGFHRYSTDAKWLLPHFEKMLYDNAQLLQVYTRAARLAEAIGAQEAELFVRTSLGIVEWLRREMTSPEGMFFSSIDADADGEEGASYVWHAKEIEMLLGPKAEAFAAAYNVEPNGNYLDEATQQPTGFNILHRTEDDGSDFRMELETVLAARRERSTPETDIKCLAAWNGMMIASLAEADEVLLAERAAHAWMKATREFGRLPHQVTGGVPSGEPYLDDVAQMILAFAALAEATGKPEYEAEALKLADFLQENYWEESKGGYTFTSDAHEELFGRSKPVFDQSMPSGNGAAVHALLAVARRDDAERALMAVIGSAQKAPQSAESLVHGALLWMMSAGEDKPEAIIAPAAPPAPTGKVIARLAEREMQAGADGWAAGVLHVSVPEGLHLNTNAPPARWLVASELVVEPLKIEVAYPPGVRDEYVGDFDIPFRLQGPGEFELRFKFQACTARECLAPDEIVIDGVVLNQ